MNKPYWSILYIISLAYAGLFLGIYHVHSSPCLLMSSHVSNVMKFVSFGGSNSATCLHDISWRKMTCLRVRHPVSFDPLQKTRWHKTFPAKFNRYHFFFWHALSFHSCITLINHRSLLLPHPSPSRLTTPYSPLLPLLLGLSDQSNTPMYESQSSNGM